MKLYNFAKAALATLVATMTIVLVQKSPAQTLESDRTAVIGSGFVTQAGQTPKGITVPPFVGALNELHEQSLKATSQLRRDIEQIEPYLYRDSSGLLAFDSKSFGRQRLSATAAVLLQASLDNVNRNIYSKSYFLNEDLSIVDQRNDVSWWIPGSGWRHTTWWGTGWAMDNTRTNWVVDTLLINRPFEIAIFVASVCFGNPVLAGAVLLLRTSIAVRLRQVNRGNGAYFMFAHPSYWLRGVPVFDFYSR